MKSVCLPERTRISGSLPRARALFITLLADPSRPGQAAIIPAYFD